MVDFYGPGGIYDYMPWWYKITLGKYHTWAEIFVKRIADGIVVLSEFTRNRALSIKSDSQKICLLHGGCDIDSIKYIDNVGNRAKFGLPIESLCFGFIGINDSEVRDIEPFISAVNKLKGSINVCWFSTGGKLSEVTKGKYNIGTNTMNMVGLTIVNTLIY